VTRTIKFAAVGTDGLQPIIWGLGATAAEAEVSACAEERECCGTQECRSCEGHGIACDGACEACDGSGLVPTGPYEIHKLSPAHAARAVTCCAWPIELDHAELVAWVEVLEDAAAEGEGDGDADAALAAARAAVRKHPEHTDTYVVRSDEGVEATFEAASFDNVPKDLRRRR